MYGMGETCTINPLQFSTGFGQVGLSLFFTYYNALRVTNLLDAALDSGGKYAVAFPYVLRDVGLAGQLTV